MRLESYLNAMNLAAAAAESSMSADIQALLIGGAIFLALMLGLLVTLSYTNMGNRHTVKEEARDMHRQTKVHGSSH